MDVILNKIYELMEKQGLNARNFEIKVGISNGSIQSWKIDKQPPHGARLQEFPKRLICPRIIFTRSPLRKRLVHNQTT